MKQVHDLGELAWSVEGYTPNLWLFERRHGVGFGAKARCVDVPPVPARVPGSVQGALRRAGLLPDWNVALQARACEWVEHRHWLFRTELPDAWMTPQGRFRLECAGLDYSGWVWVNGGEVGSFKGTHLPHVFDLTPHLRPSGNVLEIIFDLPPRWLGQFGYTSQMTEWKTRFNYTWDWVPRLVQIGLWDSIQLAVVGQGEIGDLCCTTDVDLGRGRGVLALSGAVSGGDGDRVRVALARDGAPVRSAELTLAEFAAGVVWSDLPVELWWPNREGAQPLYTVTCDLVDGQGRPLDRQVRRVGFKHVEWVPCQDAPPEADPWLCRVNGRPVFLQGVNSAPLCALYADLTRADYEARLRQYQRLGLNLFRINACQFLEREWFYDLCDELGLMVWQEFPLTSSGLENWPPEDEASIAAVAAIARSFVVRRRHHVSLLLWSGSNEQMGDLEGRKTGMGKPCDLSHPMLKRLQEVVQELDPERRYIPTSPCGPRASASPADFGKGLHWAVHGGAATGTLADAERYWAADDALFRAEVYCPGASPVALIEKYAGDLPTFPATAENPYWARLTTWWLDWHRLVALHGRDPQDLAEYVAWSQANQALMLSREIQACKARFPRCGGVLIWSGHDTFPLTINTSLIDFDGNLKPAALAVAAVWQAPAPGGDRGGTRG
ncbi:MAG: glycoside hydrolase family 2 TIM barrel-domain containing protein [Gemmatimonadota bacterium]